MLSVTTKAIVNHWVENDDDEIQDALYWRQGFDVNSGQLSVSVRSLRCTLLSFLISCSVRDPDLPL